MLGSGEMMMVFAVVVLLFGGSQIPKLACNLGRAQTEFRRGLEQLHDDEPANSATPDGD